MKKEMETNQIHKEEVSIIASVTSFLESHNIKYYMWAGTFLGAVRHKGFIPWDDDIDIAITRTDYNRLLEILRVDNKISDNLKGIGWELSNSDWPFVKIINTNILVKEEMNCDENLWIDIFPLDGIPRLNKRFYYFKIDLYNFFYRMKRMEEKKLKIHSDDKIKLFIKKLIIFILKPFSYDKIISKYISYCSKYDIENSEYVRNNVWGKAMVKKEFLNQTQKYKFEDIELVGFKDYNTVLTNFYGEDYMELPPEEKRQTHNFKAWRK